MDKATVDYSGLTTLPDDTQCKDGALAFATNAVYEDGALKTYPPALAKGLVVKKDDKVYLHSTASYTHYIIARQDGGSVLLFWVDKDTCEAETVHWTGGGIATNGETGVKSWENDEKDTDNAVTWIGSCDGTLADMVMVGNTVVMSTSASLHYLIWKSEDGDYAYLGTEVPRIDMQWGLELECGYGAVFSKFDFEDKSGGESLQYNLVGVCKYKRSGITNKTYPFKPCTEALSESDDEDEDDASNWATNDKVLIEALVYLEEIGDDLETTTTWQTQEYTGTIANITENMLVVSYTGEYGETLYMWLGADDDGILFKHGSNYYSAEIISMNDGCLTVQYQETQDYVTSTNTATYAVGDTIIIDVDGTPTRAVVEGVNETKYFVTYTDELGNSHTVPRMAGELEDYDEDEDVNDYDENEDDEGYVNMREGYTYRFSKVNQHGKADDENIRGSGETLCRLNKTQQGYKYYKAKTEKKHIGCRSNKKGAEAVVYMYESTTKSSNTDDYDFTAFEVSSENFSMLMGCMNKFMNENGKGEDKFINPFFLRYAVRLYDGSRVNASAPVLLYPNTGYAPLVRLQHGCDDDDNKETYEMDAYAFKASLVYQLHSTLGAEWKDLVLGVDVFVTPGVYSYDQGDGFVENQTDFHYRTAYSSSSKASTAAAEVLDGFGTGYSGIGYFNNGFTSAKIYADDMSSTYDPDNNVKYVGGRQASDFKAVNLVDVLNNYVYFYEGDSNKSVSTISVNERSAGEIQKELLSTANFYKIASIDFRWFCQEELDKSGSESVRLSNSPFFSLEIERGTLNSLETRETLGEDEVSNGGYRGQSLFAYNNRLHIFGGEKKLPDITIPRRQNGLYHLSDSAAKVTQALVYVKTDDGLKGVTVTDNLSYPGFPWFFYPDSRATRLLLKCGDNTYRLVDLTPHDFLNGSYFFYGPDAAVSSAGYALPGTAQTEWDDTQYSEYEPMRNKIYVSEASDPFYFKNAMVCTAGSGQVLALSCAARALSQGQFGQFPLYAFTDEGIWNITVAGDGTYSASQPMARDVVTNVQAVTQLDSKVLFMADRGVMVATGSEVTCLSDSIDGDFGQLNPLDLPRFDEFCARFLDMDGDELSGRVEAWAGKTFFDFIKECLVKYDYTHQRLVVYSPPAGVAYVYSLKSRQWGMMLTDLQDGVNSYPDALALQSTDTDGEVELADLSEYDTQAEPSPMVFVTRPAKLGDADMMKTVMSLVQRGYMRQDLEENHTLGMALYGSLDCFHWEIVETTRTHRIDNIEGTPYKYFRLAVAVRLGFRENVRGFEALYDLRGTGKLR